MIVLLSIILLGMPTLAYNYDWRLTILPQEPKSISLYSYGPLYGFFARLTFSLILIGYGIYADAQMRKTISIIITDKLLIRIKNKA